MLGYVLDEIFAGHRAPAGHPERGARVEAVREALTAAGLRERGQAIAPRAATDDELGRVHTGAYLDDLIRAVPGRSGWLDPDTYFSPGTWAAATAAAGSVADLAVRVLGGELSAGLAVVRPPGHHAEAARGMGFCLLNNIAVAAAAARAAGAARVAILDWDVHHGNGTQQIFWDDPAVLYLSVHQYPFYPGTGAPDEIGGPHARGATVNVGLAAGATDRDYLAAFDHLLCPAIERFAPDVILVSAGFDAHHADPLAGMRVTRLGFAGMAQRVRALADRLCAGRWVAALEGGYDLGGLGEGATATLAALLADRTPAPSEALLEDASSSAQEAIAATRRALEGADR
ncbi:MAG TPA: histone deacetylase [Kofleriaceae bacterium]|nr:histone deacetylase [Kofleriaceae bacterium]